LLIDIEFTRSVIGPFVSLVRHRRTEQKENNYRHCQAGRDSSAV
jgi:hypothetical protein